MKDLHSINLAKLTGPCTNRCAGKNFKRKWSEMPPIQFWTLLDLRNDIWETGDIPSIWKLANVIPIPKHGKDHSDPSNYRPITLTICVCKPMERMTNAHLVWFLESNGLLSNIQCGSVKVGTLYIILFVLKHLFETLLPKRNMLRLSFSTLKKHTTQHGNITF